MKNFKALMHKEIFVEDEAELYFVGDLHGCYDQLRDALKLQGFRAGIDHLVCVGDLADRGDKNLECLAAFIFNNPRHHCVMGNHDMFLATLGFRSDSLGMLMYNGGRWILELGDDQVEAISENILKNIPIFLTVHHRSKKYGVVHAEVPIEYKEVGVDFVTPSWDAIIKEMTATGDRLTYSGPYWRNIDPFLWGRDVISYVKETDEVVPRVEDVDYVLHGHTPQIINGIPTPLMVQNRFYIDTGAVFAGGGLTLAQAVPEEGFKTVTLYAHEPNGLWGTFN